jgi:hypothetical protein
VLGGREGKARAGRDRINADFQERNGTLKGGFSWGKRRIGIPVTIATLPARRVPVGVGDVDAEAIVLVQRKLMMRRRTKRV